MTKDELDAVIGLQEEWLKERDELREILTGCEWISDLFGNDFCCPVCQSMEMDGQHKPDCRLAKALGR